VGQLLGIWQHDVLIWKRVENAGGGNAPGIHDTEGLVAAARSLQSMSPRNVLIPAVLTFAAVVWWAGRGSVDTPEVSTATSGADAPQAATQEGLGTNKRERVDGNGSVPTVSVADATSDSSFQDYVGTKYRFLFTESGLSKGASDQLRATLSERERVAVEINTARQSSDASAKESIPRLQADLDALDRKVGMQLRPGDLAAYEVLKDSDIEQFQLEDFAGGASGVAPLSDADKKAILYTKLAYRQRFRQVLADSRFMRDDLPASERKQALAEVSRALEASRDSYLQEVRQYLHDDEQFTLLRNYETTEFNGELEKLRRIASGE
jgi:hypothetical protein